MRIIHTAAGFLSVLINTGKSFSEALILASTNPQYDKKLSMELRDQYMKTTIVEPEQGVASVHHLVMHASFSLA